MHRDADMYPTNTCRKVAEAKEPSSFKTMLGLLRLNKKPYRKDDKW